MGFGLPRVIVSEKDLSYSKPIPKLLKSSIIEKWHTQLIIVNALWNIVKRDIP